jgi:predicted dinucleotide-binding enzyme
MDIGILGSGAVGQTLGAKLADLGHAVTLGTRRPEARDEERDRASSLAQWVEASGGNGRVASYAGAAEAGELVVNATPGEVSLRVLESVGPDRLAGKILMDLSNPLDFSEGFPPSLLGGTGASLGERIQRALPDTKVVKVLNTVTAALMVDPGAVADGDHTLFLCGDDERAKESVSGWLRDWFGWTDLLDLGGLSAARGTEAYVLFWVHAMMAMGTPMFNVRIVR